MEIGHFSFILWKTLLQFEYWFLWCITRAAQCLCCKVSKTTRASSCTKFIKRKTVARCMSDIFFSPTSSILLYCVFDSNSICSFLFFDLFCDICLVVARLLILFLSTILFIFANKQLNDIIFNIFFWYFCTCTIRKSNWMIKILLKTIINTIKYLHHKILYTEIKTKKFSYRLRNENWYHRWFENKQE